MRTRGSSGAAAGFLETPPMHEEEESGRYFELEALRVEAWLHQRELCGSNRK